MKTDAPMGPDLVDDPRSLRWRPVAVAGGVIAILCGAVYGGWSVYQYNRPGATHFREGTDLAAGLHFEDAEKQWKLGVKEDPTFPGCYERLGDLYLQVHQYGPAISNYSAAIKLTPNDGSLFKRLSQSYLAEKDNRNALQAAKRAYELLPNDAEAAGAYGDLAQMTNDRITALTVLGRAHQLDPHNTRYLLTLVNVEMDVQQLDVAEKNLSPLLKDHPDDAWGMYLMSAIYNQKPRTPENLNTAIRYAETAANSPHPPLQVFPLLSQLYLDADRPQDALRVCQVIMSRNSNDTTILAKMVTCYMRLNQPAAAAQISDRLKQVAARQERIDHLQELMRFNNANVPVGLELAGLVEKMGNRELAKTYYETLVRTVPGSQPARAALRSFWLRNGRPDLAQALLRPDYVP